MSQQSREKTCPNAQIIDKTGSRNFFSAQLLRTISSFRDCHLLLSLLFAVEKFYHGVRSLPMVLFD